MNTWHDSLLAKLALDYGRFDEVRTDTDALHDTFTKIQVVVNKDSEFLTRGESGTARKAYSAVMESDSVLFSVTETVYGFATANSNKILSVENRPTESKPLTHYIASTDGITFYTAYVSKVSGVESVHITETVASETDIAMIKAFLNRVRKGEKPLRQKVAVYDNRLTVFGVIRCTESKAFSERKEIAPLWTAYRKAQDKPQK